MYIAREDPDDERGVGLADLTCGLLLLFLVTGFSRFWEWVCVCVRVLQVHVCHECRFDMEPASAQTQTKCCQIVAQSKVVRQSIWGVSKERFASAVTLRARFHRFFLIFLCGLLFFLECDGLVSDRLRSDRGYILWKPYMELYFWNRYTLFIQCVKWSDIYYWT